MDDNEILDTIIGIELGMKLIESGETEGGLKRLSFTLEKLRSKLL